MNHTAPTHGMDISKVERATSVSAVADDAPDMIKVTDVDLFYGNAQALKKINITMKKNRVTAFIGPSGCGKSTLRRKSVTLRFSS